MSKPKKRQDIDRRRMSERRQKAELRIEELKDKIAIDAHKEDQRKLNAIRDSFNHAVWQCEDQQLIHDMFSPLCQTARPSNARLIAEHPDCAEAVREELATRLAANRRAAPATAASASTADA